MTHQLPVLEVESLTHDTHRLVLPKPSGYRWNPGQATELAIDTEELRDEKRPFTLVGDPDAETLQFIIKSYANHEDGMTKHIPSLRAGDRVLLDDPWGAIHDEGPGVFLAAGTGVTPMLALLRARKRGEGVGRPGLEGCTLIDANKTAEDIIAHEELLGMKGLNTVFPLSDEVRPGHPHGQVDAHLLDAHVSDWSQIFYLCGPPPMEEAVTELLRERGVDASRLIVEQ